MIPTLPRRVLFVLAAVAAAGGASGQRAVKLPAVEDSELPNLVRVVAPAARCMAVSDTHGLIAVGHHAKGADAPVSVFKLGSDGTPTGDPVRLTHLRPAALEKIPVAALGVAFHPSLPLLYVWQDLDGPSIPVTLVRKWRTDAAELAAFDHLLIYRLDGPAPTLLASLCRGGSA